MTTTTNIISTTEVIWAAGTRVEAVSGEVAGAGEGARSSRSKSGRRNRSRIILYILQKCLVISFHIFIFRARAELKEEYSVMFAE